MKKLSLFFVTTISTLSIAYASDDDPSAKRHCVEKAEKEVTVDVRVVGNDSTWRINVLVGTTHAHLLQKTKEKISARIAWLSNKNLQIVHKKLSVPSDELLSAKTVERFPAGEPIKLVLLILNDTQECNGMQESDVQ